MSKFQKAQKANLELINEFCNLVHGDPRETLEETLERFVGSPDSDKGYNTCEVFEVSDMFISLEDVLQFHILNCSLEDFTDWYWWTVEKQMRNEDIMNLKHYLIFQKNKIKNDRKH